MNYLLRLLVSISMFSFASGALANVINKQQLDSYLTKQSKKVDWGVAVARLNSDKPIYQFHGRQLFIPASNLKLFTTAAALLTLGPDYRYHTELRTTATVLKAKVLEGDVIVHFSGDPSFNLNDLQHLFSELAALGIEKINGNIYLDGSIFADKPYMPGMIDSDKIYGYGAKLTPFIINHNQITLYLSPASQENKPALIIMSPADSAVTVNNQLTTKAAKESCQISYAMNEQNHLTVTGCMNINDDSERQTIAINNIALYTEQKVKTILQQQHIRLTGSIKQQHIANSGSLLALSQSAKLSHLVRKILKESDNLYADALFLTLGAVTNKQQGNWQNSATAVSHILQKQLKLSLKGQKIVDGSGLSRQNKIYPVTVMQLLQKMYQQFPLRYEYFNSLPVAGRDGSLSLDERTVGIYSLLRAKTGSMTGVYGLSGLLETKQQQPLVFTVLTNDAKYSKKYLQKRIFTFCHLLFDGKPAKFNKNDSASLEDQIRDLLRGKSVDLIRLNDKILLFSQQGLAKSLQAQIEQLVTDKRIVILRGSHDRNGQSGQFLVSQQHSVNQPIMELLLSEAQS